MTEDKVVSFGTKSRVRAEAEARRRALVDRFRQHLRIVSRAVRECVRAARHPRRSRMRLGWLPKK